jgi:thioredoxin 1
MINTFDDNNWENIKKEEISVIQFSASWCSPCKELTPVLEKLSKNFEGKATFYYADVEEGGLNKGSELGIRGVPSTILFKRGVEVDRLVGYPGEAKVSEWLSKNI